MARPNRVSLVRTRIAAHDRTRLGRAARGPARAARAGHAALFVALLAPVAGLLTDRFGRRSVLVWALGLYAAAGVAPFWIDNLYAIILTRAVVGIAEAGVMTASTALICDYFTGQRRAHWLSVQFGSAALVATVCFVLAGFLGNYNWRAPFLVYGATALFIPMILAIIFEPARAAPGKAAHFSAADSLQGLVDLRFVGSLSATLICGALFYITPVHISLVLNERGYSDPSMLGLASAMGSLGVVAGAAFFRFQSRRPVGALLAGAMVTQAVGFAVLYTQSSLAGGIVGMFINNLGCGVSASPPTRSIWPAWSPRRFLTIGWRSQCRSATLSKKRASSGRKIYMDRLHRPCT